AAMGLFPDELHQRIAAQALGESPGRGLVAPHQGRLDDEAPIHAEVERELHRLHGVVATIGIARVIRLAHAGDEMTGAATRADGGGKSEEEKVAPRDEGGGKPVGAEGDLRLAGECRVTDRAERVEIDEMRLAQLLAPMRKSPAKRGGSPLPALQL